MDERPPWSLAMKAGMVAALMPLAVLLVTAIAFHSIAPQVIFPATIAALVAGIVLARRLVVRAGFTMAPWLLGLGFLATAIPAFRAGPAGIAAGWLIVSTALVRLVAKRPRDPSDPSVSGL
jgi:hypothetical protein